MAAARSPRPLVADFRSRQPSGARDTANGPGNARAETAVLTRHDTPGVGGVRTEPSVYGGGLRMEKSMYACD
eukprot:gene29286-63458_t